MCVQSEDDRNVRFLLALLLIRSFPGVIQCWALANVRRDLPELPATILVKCLDMVAIVMAYASAISGMAPCAIQRTESAYVPLDFMVLGECTERLANIHCLQLLLQM